MSVTSLLWGRSVGAREAVAAAEEGLAVDSSTTKGRSPPCPRRECRTWPRYTLRCVLCVCFVLARLSFWFCCCPTQCCSDVEASAATDRLKPGLSCYLCRHLSTAVTIPTTTNNNNNGWQTAMVGNCTPLFVFCITIDRPSYERLQANLEHLRDNHRKALKLLASCHGFQGAEEYSGPGEAVGPPYFNNMARKK